MQNENSLKLVSSYRGYIMGFAALWIWFFHEWEPVVDWVPRLAFFEGFIKRIGFVSVDIFFFLSGMGLIHAISKHSTAEFYKRRLSRIFLPFFLVGFCRMLLENWPIDTFLKHVSGYNFYAANMYSFLWFVPAIATLYLLFPIFYRIFQKAPSKTQFMYLLLIIWLFLSMQFSNTLRTDLFGFTNRIPVFLTGVLTGWYVRENQITFTKLTWTACLITFFFGIYLAFETNYRDMYLLVPVSNCCVPNFLMASSGTFLLAKLFSFFDSWKSRISQSILKILSFYGKMSLEFYCVQEWIGGMLKGRLPDTLSDPVINLLDLLACTLCAVILVKACSLIKSLFSKLFSQRS